MKKILVSILTISALATLNMTTHAFQSTKNIESATDAFKRTKTKEPSMYERAQGMYSNTIDKLNDPNSTLNRAGNSANKAGSGFLNKVFGSNKNEPKAAPAPKPAPTPIITRTPPPTVATTPQPTRDTLRDKSGRMADDSKAFADAAAARAREAERLSKGSLVDKARLATGRF